MARFAFVLPLLLLPALLFSAAPPVRGPAAFSLDKRVPLTTSRVIGSPEPPPPYVTRRVFEKQTFRNPLYVTSHPAHDRVFVIEQAGRILCLDPKDKQPTFDFCKLPDIDFYGMTFHPDYRKNRFVYVFANGPNSAKRKNNQILRFTTAGDPPKCDLTTKKLILEYDSNGHNGGDLGFGPDGMLYFTSGDGTTDSDTNNTGQDVSDLTSGVIRIDIERPDKGKGYSIPKDNPFLNTKGARGELWAFGFRNPWRMHFDSVSGDLFVADIGQDAMEMVYLVKKGGNYGWSIKEGSLDFQPLRKKGPAEILPPLIEHPHSESRSITGGFVYRGKKFPELKDTYLYGDYSTGKVWGLRQKGGKITWKGDLAWTRLQTLGFGTDADGNVYLADYAGSIHVLEKAPPVPDKERVEFPRKLSESGLFTARGEPLPGLIPYEVNSPLWSDGADKERFIALPGDERIGFTEKGPWQLPERTVLVKTFSIDTPKGKRKIETRFLTLQRGEWAGYSYAWNAEQTDAELVEVGGKSVSFTTKGDGELKWRYPSRVECMVCHTRASAYVLGVTTGQLNRTRDYGGVRMNQLTALEKLGLFRVSKADHYRVLEERLETLDALARLTLPLGVDSETAKKERDRKSQQAKQKREQLYRKHGGDTHLLPRLAEEYEALANPYEGTDLEARARSYLHVNCAICHVEAGGGNAAIDLHVGRPRDKMRLIGVAPIHDRFGLDDAKLVAPGAPERSVLYHRVSLRGRGQMPPLATTKVDERAQRLLGDWIRGLKQ